eukprot:340216-Chlamydomonas_euryale.AAC.2
MASGARRPARPQRRRHVAVGALAATGAGPRRRVCGAGRAHRPTRVAGGAWVRRPWMEAGGKAWENPRGVGVDGEKLGEAIGGGRRDVGNVALQLGKGEGGRRGHSARCHA